MAVWLITGASRGLGADLTERALAEGHAVIAGARMPSGAARTTLEHTRLLRVPLDVTDAAQVDGAVAAGVEHFGRIDVVVLNAGAGLVGAIEEVSDAEATQLFEVNVLGALRVMRAALPVVRAQSSGRIIAISSSVGFSAPAFHGIYAASKFALEAMTESVDAEMRPFGARATIVELGGFRTDFLSRTSIRTAAAEVPEYSGQGGVNHRRRLIDSNGTQPGDPRRAAAAIVRLAELADPPLRVQLGNDSVARVEAKLELVRRELDEWRWLASSTDFTADEADGR